MKYYIIFVILLVNLQAHDVNEKSKKIVQDIYMKQLESIRPDVAKNIKQAIKEASEIKKASNVIYCLISESTPIEYIKTILMQGTALKVEDGVDIVFVLRGFYSKKFMANLKQVSDDMSEYEYVDTFRKNITIVMSPKIFTDFKVNKAPALMFGRYTNGNYPESEYIQYVARGDIGLEIFFDLIIQKDYSFEQYKKTISTLY